MNDATSQRDADLSFNYFPTDYRWSHGLLIGLNAAPWGGAEIGEINRIGLKLRGCEGDDQAWFREWAAMADKVEAEGRARLAAGYRRSAAAYLMRAANYYHVGERFLHPKTGESNAAYKRGVECFKEAVKHIARPRVTPVEIPFGKTRLPALYVHAEPVGGKTGRTPALIYFDGFDITKEIQYFKGVPDLVARGIACLIVDGPGNGESIRFRNLPLRHDTESYASAAYEFLAKRPEIDPKRIGIMAISLGGYYAPRAAAFEPRLAACIAWGAQWDYWQIWHDRFERLARANTPALSVPWQHLLWEFGVKTKEEAMKKLEDFRLERVVGRIKCPFLLVHGEGDEQIPLPIAERCFAAVGSKNKTFKVFTREEGGYHHCQIDNASIGTAYMWDWLEDVLKPGRPAEAAKPARKSAARRRAKKAKRRARRR